MDPLSSASDLGGDPASPTLRECAAMSNMVDLRVSALLCARLCHELSGPIAAINNGLELLADNDRDYVHDAVTLIGVSARQAVDRLQFYRFAYGFSGGTIAPGVQPHDIAGRLFDGSRITCEYGEGAAALPLERQRLACNLLLLGAEALPRGGHLVFDAATLEVKAIGEAAALSPETVAALTLVTPVDALTSRTVQGYFAGVLAASLGCLLVWAAGPRRVRLAAVASAD